MLFILFAPRPEDLKELDLVFDDKFYDAVPRSDDEIVEHFQAAMLDSIKDWTLDDLRGRLALMKLDNYPDDELQVMFLMARLEELEAAQNGG